jgi:chemosensory pili system protein ChpA (sensor histidine kinase/response regulator)
MEPLLQAFAPGQTVSVPAEGAARVLVVDDSVVAREAAAAALRAAGVTFDLARDGREALTKLERGHYAVVLSDLEMPRLDGFGLVEQLRTDARLRDLPVVVCSSRLDEEARRRLSRFGVGGYVEKPFAAEDLLGALQPWLAAEGRGG